MSNVNDNPVTVTCPHCPASFTKPTAVKAKSALHMHNVRTHKPRVAHNRFNAVEWEGRWHLSCPKCNLAMQSAKLRCLTGNYQRHVNNCKAVAAAPTPAKAPTPTPIRLATAPEKSHDSPTVEALRKFTPRQPRKEMVRWTEEEIEAIVQRAAEMRMAEAEPPLLHIIAQAQEVLPTNRQRTLLGWNSIPGDFKAKVQIRIDAIRKQELESVPPNVITVPVEVPVAINPKEFLASLDTPALLAEAFTRLLKRFDNLEAALLHRPKEVHHNGNGNGNGVHRPAPTLAATPPAPPRKPRIAVVGLLKDQFEHVVTKCASRNVDLFWVDKDQSKTKFPTTTDFVIVERHLDHRWAATARQTLSNDQVAYTNGIEGVVGKVYDFASRNHQAARA